MMDGMDLRRRMGWSAAAAKTLARARCCGAGSRPGAGHRRGLPEAGPGAGAAAGAAAAPPGRAALARGAKALPRVAHWAPRLAMAPVAALAMALAVAAPGMAQPAADCEGLREGASLAYRNPRWGFGMDYPASFALDPDSVPENGDSARFWTAGRQATAVVTGLRNGEGQSLAEVLAEAERDIRDNGRGSITYRRVTPGLVRAVRLPCRPDLLPAQLPGARRRSDRHALDRIPAAR